MLLFFAKLNILGEQLEQTWARGQRCNAVKLKDVMHLRMLVIGQSDSLPGHQVDQHQEEASKSRRNLPAGRLSAQR